MSDGVTLSYHNMFRLYGVIFRCSIEPTLKCLKYFAKILRLAQYYT
jgi:hypothetical protein